MKQKFKIFMFIFFTITIIANTVRAAGVDGTTIVLNAGHGGSWTGCANAARGLVEKNVTLKIANYLKEILDKYYGVNVILTHDGVSFPNNDASDLAARAMVARNNNADLYVSLHINSSTSRAIRGANVYVTSRTEQYKYKDGMTELGEIILAKLENLGIQNDGVINNKLCQDYEPKFQYYDGSQADYYADIRCAMKGDSEDYGADFSDGSGVSAVLIEHCYMSNEEDCNFIDSDYDLQRMAQADADAIIEYYGLRLSQSVVANMNIDTSRINLLVGESLQRTATVSPETASNKEIIWKSDDENVATVDNSGKITAVGKGTAHVTATSADNSNVTETISVNVEKEEIYFDEEQTNIVVGLEKTLEVNATPSWVTDKNITWETSDSSVVEVNQEGKITAKKAGTAEIKATWKEKNLSAKITVNSVELPEETSIAIKNYTVNGNKISKIGQKVSQEDFLANIQVSSNLEVEIEYQNEGQSYIGTNTKVKIFEKETGLVIQEYKCLIYGDINGDGKISALDYTLIKNHMMSVKDITTGIMKTAADVNGDGKISALDYTLIKNDIMGVKKVELR